jgi:hypothetical protein
MDMNWIKIGVYGWGFVSAILAGSLLANMIFGRSSWITANNGSVLAAIIAAGALTWSLFFQADVSRNDVLKELTSIKTGMAKIETKFNGLASKSDYDQILKTLERIERRP